MTMMILFWTKFEHVFCRGAHDRTSRRQWAIVTDFAIMFTIFDEIKCGINIAYIFGLCFILLMLLGG